MVSTRSSAQKSVGPSTPASNSSSIATNGNGNGNGYSKKRGGETHGVTNGHNQDHGHENGHEAKRQRVAEPVDRTRWRMKSDGGCHTWHFLDDDDAVKKWPQSYADKWYLDLPLVSVLTDSHAFE